MIVRGCSADYRFSSASAIVDRFSICYALAMAESQQRVMVYGDSLILAGVQVALQAHPGIEVISVNTSGDDLAEELLALRPVAVVFDLGGIHPSVPAMLLLSDLVLIGIDPERSQALVWSRRCEVAVATTDLLDLIGAIGCTDSGRRPRPAVEG